MSNPSQDQPVNPVPGFEHPYPAGQAYTGRQQEPQSPWPRPSEQPPKQRVKEKRFGWLAMIITFVIGCALGFAVGSQPVEQESGAFTQGTGYHSTEPETVPEATDTETAAAPTEAPTTEAPRPAEPKITRAQKEALESAESYLDSGHFSKAGLLDQLTSEYGEDFDKKDAQWAIAHVDADYKAEAVEAAESYLDSGHFSKRELHNQLTSKYGEGFTDAEASYAVAKVY